MLGLADSFMNASRFRADREDAARQAELEQQRFAMEQSRFNLDQQAQQLRLDEARRLADARKAYQLAMANADQGALPGPMVQPDSYTGVPPAQAAMLENNAPMQGMVAPPPIQMPPQALPPQDVRRRRAAATREYMIASDRPDDVLKLDREEAQQERLDAVRADVDRIAKMSPEELKQQFVEYYGRGQEVIPEWDPKTKDYSLVSTRDDFPSQRVSLGEMRIAVQALAYQKNGFLEEAMRLKEGTLKSMRDAEKATFDRGATLAGAREDAYYKNRRDQRDSEELGIRRSTAARAERRAAAADWEMVGFDPETRTLMQRNKLDGTYKNDPLPPGMAGIMMLRRLYPPADQLTTSQRMDLLTKIRETNPTLSLQGAAEALSEMEQVLAGRQPMSVAERMRADLGLGAPAAAPAAAMPAPAPRQLPPAALPPGRAANSPTGY